MKVVVQMCACGGFVSKFPLLVGELLPKKLYPCGVSPAPAPAHEPELTANLFQSGKQPTFLNGLSGLYPVPLYDLSSRL